MVTCRLISGILCILCISTIFDIFYIYRNFDKWTGEPHPSWHIDVHGILMFMAFFKVIRCVYYTNMLNMLNMYNMCISTKPGAYLCPGKNMQNIHNILFH